MTEHDPADGPTGLAAPRRLSEREPGQGHMVEFGSNPTAFMMRARAECGASLVA